MGRGLLLWLIGIPIPIILLIWLFCGLHEMSELIKFVGLQGSKRWVVKSREWERAFGDKRKAIHCAVELANESGKNGKPALVLAGSRRHEFAPIWTFGKDSYPLARS